MSDEREAMFRQVSEAATQPQTAPRDEMAVLADWLDEHGEPDLAFAYRWAAGRGRYPIVTPKRKWAFWSTLSRGQHKPAWPHQLPREVFHWLKPSRGKCRYRDVAMAFVRLAAALKRLRDCLSVPAMKGAPPP